MKESPVTQTTTTIQRNTRQRGERGTGSTITIDLSEYPELLSEIRDAAKSDDREPSKWLRRAIVINAHHLFRDSRAGQVGKVAPPKPRESGLLTEE
jgi:hypothetical protein